MAVYKKARDQIQLVRQARGYFSGKAEPSPAAKEERQQRLKEMMKTAPCRKCGGFGHWSRDPECPKNAGAGPKQAEHGVMVALPARPADAGALQHLRELAWSKYKVRDSRVAAAEVLMAMPEDRVSDEELEGYVVIDLGCLGQ